MNMRQTALQIEDSKQGDIGCVYVCSTIYCKISFHTSDLLRTKLVNYNSFGVCFLR